LVRSCRRELFMGKGIKVVIGGRVINLMRERERERERLKVKFARV
jgi:hypothetical protein